MYILYSFSRMLEFWYDCLMKYCQHDKIKLLEMDTDSFYFAIADDKFETIIKPEMYSSYHEAVFGSCQDDTEPEFFPRKCCDKHKTHDKRTPGIN